MARFSKLGFLACALALIALSERGADAQTVSPVATWRFEPGNFFADSTGTNTLIDGNGATKAQSVTATIGPAGGGGSALFDGTAVLRTAAPLNLSTFTHLRIGWIQRSQATVLISPRIVFEHSSNFNLSAGAFAVAANSNLPGTTAPPTQGFVALMGQTISSELFTMSAAAVPGTWQQFSADIDLTPGAVSVITISDANLNPIGIPLQQGVLPVSFINDILYIGARGNTATNGFVGNIDEVTISSVTQVPIPNPTPTPNPNPTNPTNPIPFNPLTTPFTPNASGANGVIVDAEGVLRLQHFPDPGGQLARKRIAEAKAHLNPQVARPSKLRKVSLNRLEAAVRGQLEAGRAPSEEMQFLAGLTRVRYVFYYPETKDIVLAGPAEGWAADVSGRVCGIASGRPSLELQDLVVALRAFAPGGRPAPVILCSIDPTPEGLSRMQQFLRGVGSQITPSDTEMIVDGLRSNLGMQNIRIGGIAANTHFAQVLLECDYRMKLIGIGLEKPPVRVVSYVDAAKPGGSRNALTRWYFIPDYNSVRVAADNLGLELVGEVVKLVTEDQLVAHDGSRSVSGKTNRASEVFTKTFTQKYAELAARVPVFAEMRNLIDLAIAAAFIHKQDFYAQAGWPAATFNDEQSIHAETYRTPMQVESVCTAVWKGNRLMTPIGGGVTIHPQEALRSTNTLADKDGKVSEAREAVGLKQIPAGRWWWD